MLDEDKLNKIKFCKDTLIGQIEYTIKRAQPIQSSLTKEVLISLVYIEIFSDYLKEQNFNTLEEAWRFMNDIKGINEKIFYISHYIDITEQSIKESQAKK